MDSVGSLIACEAWTNVAPVETNGRVDPGQVSPGWRVLSGARAFWRAFWLLSGERELADRVRARGRQSVEVFGRVWRRDVRA